MSIYSICPFIVMIGLDIRLDDRTRGRKSRQLTATDNGCGAADGSKRTESHTEVFVRLQGAAPRRPVNGSPER